MTIFLQKNGIFIFLKNTNKKKDKKNILLFQTLFFFIFYFVFFLNKKGKSWVKVEQKSWVFIIPLIIIYITLRKKKKNQNFLYQL
jgi:hypothetical protein